MASGIRPRAPWRAVAIPSEHGGWALTMEPVLLGLLVSFSWSGLAIGGAAVLAFLVRTPLKIALGDHRRGRKLARTRLAERIAFGELVLLTVFAAGAVRGAGWGWLAPVALAVTFFALEFWFDVRSRSRRLVPELSGAIAIASASAAIILAGGSGARLAAAAWLVLSARSVASIPFVRTQIVRLHHGTAPIATSDAFQAAGVLIGIGAAAVDRQVVGGTAGVIVLAAVQLWWMRRPVPEAKVLGLWQMVLGLGLVGATAISVLAWP